MNKVAKLDNIADLGKFYGIPIPLNLKANIKP